MLELFLTALCTLGFVLYVQARAAAREKRLNDTRYRPAVRSRRMQKRRA